VHDSRVVVGGQAGDNADGKTENDDRVAAEQAASFLLGPAGTTVHKMVRRPDVHKSVPKAHENGPRRVLRGPIPLVAGTGFEPCDLRVMSYVPRVLPCLLGPKCAGKSASGVLAVTPGRTDVRPFRRVLFPNLFPKLATHCLAARPQNSSDWPATDSRCGGAPKPFLFGRA
jgi:hypothetical protein